MALTYQQVLIPTNQDLWRDLPDIPYAWLGGTLQYALFEEDGKRYITVRGETDNNKGGSITDDNIDRVARGFFFQDQSFGYDSMDGFVVIYVQATKKWYTKSLQLKYYQYDLNSVTQDLTHFPSSWKWNCEVVKVVVSEEVTCTRRVPAVPDFETGEIIYIPQIVVNNIGFSWHGSKADTGSYEFGGQVTLNSAFLGFSVITLSYAMLI